MHHVQFHHQQTVFVLPATFSQCRAQEGKGGSLGADHDFNHLDPEFREKFIHVLASLLSLGYHPIFLEGYRSPARQQALLDESRDGLAVTRAGQCSSYHQLGLASDIAFVNPKTGYVTQNMKDPWTKQAFDAYGKLATEEGLRWGGKWHDFAHVELPRLRPDPLFKESPSDSLMAEERFVWGVGEARTCLNTNPFNINQGGLFSNEISFANQEG